MEGGRLLYGDVTLKFRRQGKESERKQSGGILAVRGLYVSFIRLSSWELKIWVLVPNLQLIFFNIFFMYTS